MMSFATLTIQIALMVFLAWGGMLSLAYIAREGARDFWAGW